MEEIQVCYQCSECRWNACPQVAKAFAELRENMPSNIFFNRHNLNHISEFILNQKGSHTDFRICTEELLCDLNGAESIVADMQEKFGKLSSWVIDLYQTCRDSENETFNKFADILVDRYYDQLANLGVDLYGSNT